MARSGLPTDYQVYLGAVVVLVQTLRSCKLMISQ